MKLSYILESVRGIRKNRLPGQLIVQITDLCNATCPQCGMNNQNRYKRSSLDRDEIFRIIDTAVGRGIKAISFTGGEPFLFQRDLFDYIRYASEKGIKYTRTGTNGFIFMGSEKSDFEERIENLAENIKESGLYTFWISIDSWDIDKHEKNRGLNGVIKGIEKGLKIFERYSLYPSANLGLNRLVEIPEIAYEKDGKFSPEKFYETYYKGLSKFFEFVEDLGFTIVNLCYPMSFEGAVYKAESSDRMVKYTDEEKKILFKVIFDLLPIYKKRLRIFTPLSSIYVLMKQYDSQDIAKFACRGGKDYFFVDSKGDLYPCGFLAEENLGKFTDNDILRYEKDCIRCDWECFRDPSILFAPVLGFGNSAFREIFSIKKDPTFYRLWFKDLFYYKKSRFFSMHTPLNKKAFKRN